MNKYAKYIKSINYFDNYIQIKPYLNSVIILYISKLNNYDKYSIELIHIYHNIYHHKKINIYKTPILSIASEIFNNYINNNNILFLLNSIERKKWLEYYVKNIELQYYTLTQKKIINIPNINAQVTAGFIYNLVQQIPCYYEVKLTITQNNYSYLINSHIVKIESVIKNSNGEYYLKTIIAYESDDFINASKAFDYILTCTYIYKLYISSIEKNDMYYLNISEWIINNNYLNKLKNKFEARIRSETSFT